MGGAFPELVQRQAQIAAALEQEETAFNRTLDRGLALFERAAASVRDGEFPAATAFELSDTYGFPNDLTALLCDERGLRLDHAAVEALLERQRAQSRQAQRRTRVAALEATSDVRTEFTGYHEDSSEARVVDLVRDGGKTYLIVDRCPLYAEMGGQVGDTGTLEAGGETVAVTDVLKIADALALEVDKVPGAYREGEPLQAAVHLDAPRRRAIEAHHTATHLLHWALHEIVGPDVAQQGSLVAHDRLRFDFNSAPLDADQIAAVEERVRAKIASDDTVTWTEVAHAEVRGRPDVMQFFGDKYGERVRVVQIGGRQGALDGYSMELCGGTHVRRTSQIGAFKIRSEGAIAAGVRRVEAVCGPAAEAYLDETAKALESECTALGAKLTAANAALAAAGGEAVPAPAKGSADNGDLGGLTAFRDTLRQAAAEADKRLKKARAGKAAAAAREALAGRLAATGQGGALVESFEGGADLLQEALAVLKKNRFDGTAVIAVDDGEKLHLGTYVGPARSGTENAGDLLKELAPIVGGRGGGNPETARGAGPDREKLRDLLDAARKRLG
jgi:alanyl-tRNA synthetase